METETTQLKSESKDKKYSVKFLMPIYVINESTEKYKITEKQFKYMKHIQEVLSERIDLTILVIGSENELSRNLTLKYFDESCYIEVPQSIDYFTTQNQVSLTKELSVKVLTGYIHAKSMNPDMIIFMKSNHFVPIKWVDEIVEHDKMNTGNKNFYGFSQDNAFILTCIDDNGNIDKTNGMILGNIGDTPYIKYRHTWFVSKGYGEACCIGIPRQIYLKDKNKPERTIYIQENVWQEGLIALGHRFYETKKHWVFNIKSIKDDRENHSGFNLWVGRGKDTINNDWNLLFKEPGLEEVVNFLNSS